MVVVGPCTGTISALDHGEFTIGRDPSSRLCIPNAHMSMRHCVICYEDGKYKLVDLRSKNGTKVNNKLIDEHILQHGDHISMAGSSLKFVCQSEASAESVQWVKTPLPTDRAIRLRPHETLYLNPTKTAAIPRPARRERDLHLLFTIATKIAAIRDRETLLWQIIETIFHGIPAQRGTIVLTDPEFAEVKLSISWDNKTGPAQTMQVGLEVAREAMAECVSIMVSNPVTATMSRNATAFVTGLLCAPLIAPTRVLGVIYLETSHPTIRFDAQHLELLTAAASLTALSLNSLSSVEATMADNLRLRSLLDDFHQRKKVRA